jgi:hypothetical protein
MTHEERREQWQGVVSRWRESGMSQAAWCRQEGVALASLRQWAVKLRPEASSASAGFVRIDGGALPVLETGAILELCVGDLRARLPLAADESEILKVLRALSGLGGGR